MYVWKSLIFCLLSFLYVTLAFKEQKFTTLDSVKSYTSQDDQTKAVQSLINRFLGNKSFGVVAKVVSSTDQEHVYVCKTFCKCL